MGEDKGLMLLRGRPLIAYVLDAVARCGPAISTIRISTANPAYRQFGYPLLADLVPDCGPLGGIHAALQTAATETVLVAGCDLPFVTHETIARLGERMRSQPSAVVVAAYAGQPQPLLGFYQRSALPILARRMEQRQLRLREFLAEAGATKVELQGVVPENSFFNVNTPEEFAEASGCLKSSKQEKT